MFDMCIYKLASLLQNDDYLYEVPVSCFNFLLKNQISLQLSNFNLKLTLVESFF